jgi:hypothetical protein
MCNVLDLLHTSQVCLLDGAEVQCAEFCQSDILPVNSQDVNTGATWQTTKRQFCLAHYSADLSPATFDPFRVVTSHLKRWYFKRMTDALKNIPENDFQQCFQELYSKRQKSPKDSTQRAVLSNIKFP